MPFRAVIVFLVNLSFASVAAAADVYISQTATGADTGASCSNAHSVPWFNNPANWGTAVNRIGPGTVVHLCGTISAPLTVQGGGTNGSPITIHWETDAKLSLPAATMMSLGGQSYITLDGGTNGIIENTDNGSLLGSHVATHGINGTLSGNIEVKNLACRNMYVHRSANDVSIDGTFSTCYYANGITGPISIHDNTLIDVCWAIEILSAGAALGSPTIDIYNNLFRNYDHAVAITGGPNQVSMNIYHNTFGDTAVWDTTVGAYHHDGIHVFSGNTWNDGNALMIFNNIFNGDYGANNTAHIFLDNAAGPPKNVSVFNNIFIQYPGSYLNNGFIAGGGPNNKIYNNTFMGAGLYNQPCILFTGATTTITLRNNVLSGCNTFVSVTASATITDATGNVYAAQGPGGNSRWNWRGAQTNVLSAWQGSCNCDSGSSYQATAALDQTGYPQRDSPVLGIAVNLSPLNIVALNADINRIPRPASGAWDAGAYMLVRSRPAPPTSLSAQ